MTQHEEILDFLKDHESITPMDAFRELGITKLSTRIGELERLGHDFGKEWIIVKRGDKTIQYMSYSLLNR